MNTNANTQAAVTVDLDTLLKGIAPVPAAAPVAAAPIFSAPAAPIFSAPAPVAAAPIFSAPLPPAAPIFSVPALAPDVVETVIAKVEGEQALQQSYNSAAGETPVVETPTQATPEEPAAPAAKATRRRALSDQIALIKNQAPVSIPTLVDALPVKQQEKARNLLAFLQSGVKPSVYAEIALKMLVAKGTLTSAELRAELMKKYSEGTANSQTQQMMHVLSKLGCAVGTGKEISLAQDSLIVEKFQTAFMQSL